MARKSRRSNNNKNKTGKDIPDKKEAEVRNAKNVPNNSSSVSASNASDASSGNSDTATTSKDSNRPAMREATPNARGVTNDPEWYSRDNQLVLDAASLPYSEPLGDPLQIFDPSISVYEFGSNFTNVGAGKSESVPGILTCRTKASFGESTNIRSPLNVAAQMLYTHVRYMNSGRKNYDPTDLMMYVGSMADVYSYIIWMQRIYAKAFLYSQRNKFIGDMLLTSEYIDAQDVKLNLANMRYWINTYVNKISAYAIPADIYYFNRRAWIYSSIYLENPDGNIKDQLYQFSPDGFYRFELDSNGAGMLKYYKLSEILTPASPNGYTFQELVQIGEFLLANVTGDEDFGLMSGDVIKAFEGRIIGLPSLPEVVDIVPVYSEYVLEQMQNATVLDCIRGSSTVDNLGDVTQTANGILVSREAIYVEDASYNVDHEMQNITYHARKLISCNTPVPNPIDNMELTRLTLGRGSRYLLSDGVTKVGAVVCGADYVTRVSLTWVEADGTPHVDRGYIRQNWWNIDWMKNTSWPVWGFGLAGIRAFKYAPIMWLYYLTAESGGSNSVTTVMPFGNINNYTILNEVALNKLHEVALLSMLSVPGVAKLVNI